MELKGSDRLCLSSAVISHRPFAISHTELRRSTAFFSFRKDFIPLTHFSCYCKVTSLILIDYAVVLPGFQLEVSYKRYRLRSRSGRWGAGRVSETKRNAMYTRKCLGPR